MNFNYLFKIIKEFIWRDLFLFLAFKKENPGKMSDLNSVLLSIIEECKAANAHFQVWWALRSLALPAYYDTMNECKYVDFFHANNSGHYKLFYIALSKIYDRDERASGIRELKKRLDENGYAELATFVNNELTPMTEIVKKIKTIRNQSIVHNQADLPRKTVYKKNQITPNQIREVISKTIQVLNVVSDGVGVKDPIFENERLVEATIEMLKTLEKGRQ
jgi:hypothetical protein